MRWSVAVAVVVALVALNTDAVPMINEDGGAARRFRTHLSTCGSLSGALMQVCSPPRSSGRSTPSLMTWQRVSPCSPRRTRRRWPTLRSSRMEMPTLRRYVVDRSQAHARDVPFAGRGRRCTSHAGGRVDSQRCRRHQGCGRSR